MKITKLLWTRDNIGHIAKHNIIPEEVEDLCFRDEPRIKKGRMKTYNILGQTLSGRYLFEVIALRRKGVAYVVTARDMDNKEKKLYRKLVGG